MILLEQLYRLLPADDQTRPLDPLFEVSSASGTAVLVEAAVLCPERHALLLTHVLGVFDPGAAQNVAVGTHLRIQRGDATTLVHLDELGVAAAANANVILAWQGEAVLQPGGEVRASGTFNAAVAANALALHVHGMLIPLGSIQRT